MMKKMSEPTIVGSIRTSQPINTEIQSDQYDHQF